MSENERKISTTTISTIAIHSGKTKIVMALLKSGDLLELKILELVPGLTVLGETFEEASELENTHCHVLQQLQNKQSPVEELLEKADQVIAEQKPQAEVYIAMAESMGQAWNDINSYLMLRKHILHLNVTYHSKAEACAERMRVLERLCLSPMPPNEEALEESLNCMQEVKKSMLECLMGALKAGQSLLGALNELAAKGAIDSRIRLMKRSVQSAIAQVEKWMEDLHNRRRVLDVTWQRRKLNLEKYRTLSILKCDLELLETLLKERYRKLVRGKDVLGESALDADDLLTHHLQLLPEAKNLQEEGVRMVKASEQLPSSSHKFSGESNKIAYDVLSMANEYMQAINDREQLLRKSARFFNEAKSVILKLEEMNYQLKNVNSTSERLIIMNMTDEITKDIIKDGHCILEYAPGANGVERILSEIENTKAEIMNFCIRENDEIFEVSQIVNTFYEKYNQIYSWLITAVEGVIHRQQNMGGGLQGAQAFLFQHQKLVNEIKSRNTDIAELSECVPFEVRERLQPNTKDDIANKVETIVQRFNVSKAAAEKRVSLATKYVEFHTLASSLETELDAFARSLGGIDSAEVLELVEPASLKIKQLHSQLVVAAENFVDELSQTRDSYLDAKRAQLCVETVLEHFANRKSDLEDKWNIWEKSALDKETSQALWIKNMVDSENTIDWVIKLESQLYPVLNSETTDADTQTCQVEHKLSHIIPEIKRAQQEIQLRIKTAKELIVGGALENDVEVPPKLQELHDSVCNIIVDYTIFLEVLASFLKSIKELDRKIIDLKDMNEAMRKFSPQQVNDVRIKHIAASKAFFDLWTICYNDSRRVIEKIQLQEPTKYADKDARAVDNLIETKKLEWNCLSTIVEQSLRSLQMLKQFDQDLESINNSIKELSDELATLQNQYNLSLSAAKSSSFAFQSLDKTIQATETKIKSFLSTAEDALRTNESRSEEIEQEVSHLKERWNKFCVQVAELKHFIDLSIQYFSLIEETEECFREGTKLLVSIARKSSTARSAEEVEQLSKDIKLFLKSSEVKQEERITKISHLVSQIFNDDDEHRRQVAQIVAENQDMLESFSTVSNELTTLQNKLGLIPNAPESAEHQAPEVVSVEKLPSPLAVEKVEVVDVAESEPPSSTEVFDIVETSLIPPSSPPVKKTKFCEQACTPLKAPDFICPLADAIVQEGTRFIFECEVEGQPVPEIKWFKEGLSIDTNSDYRTTFEKGVCRLTIEEVIAEDSAKFSCLAVNKAGAAETFCNLLIIEKDSKKDDLRPPKFVLPLQDASAIEDESCELRCKVTGNPLPVIQWSRNDVCIDSHPHFDITYNNGDAKLVIKSASKEDDATFTCTAVNSVGSLISSCLVRVVDRRTSGELPAFSSCLSNVMVRAGQKLKLECSVIGKPFPDLTWYHNGKLLNELPNIITSVDDSGNIVLIILEAFPKDAGEYTLVASNSVGEISCSCNVSVKGLLPCETSDSEIPSDVEPIRPSINTPLNDVIAVEGSEALLECVIVGQPEPEVIWYHNGEPIKEGDRIQLYFKGDKCSMHVKELRGDDAGVYKVVAINSAGEISSTCQLVVSEIVSAEQETTEKPELTAPKFNKLLSDVLIREGDTAVLECSVTGFPPPEVKWYLNSSELKFDDRVKLQKYVDGSVTLTVQNVTPEDKGLYTVRASNSSGEAKCFSHVIVKSLSSVGETKSSDAVHLEDRYERPTFAQLFYDKVAVEGEPVRFECIVKGKPAPKVRWLFNNEPVSGKSYLVSTSGERQVLCIPEAGRENAGLISCVAKNDVGEACCEAHLHLTEGVVQEKLIPSMNTTMNVFESSNSYEVNKSTVSKTVAFNNEAPITKTDTFLNVAEQSSRKTNDSEPIKSESRHVEEKHEITNGTHTDFSSQLHSPKLNGVASLKPARKQTAPRFISTIKGAIVDPGRDVSFEAAVESYPPANIVWYKNNNQLSNEPNKMRMTWELNRATLEIYHVNSSDAGRYTCSASNGSGIASSSADLFVKKTAFPPVMGKRLHPQSIAVGKRVVFEIEVTGTPTPLVTWYKDEVQLARTSPFYRLREQGNSHALIIAEARFEDSGQYKVKAHNEAGEAVSLAPLNVFEPPPSVAESSTFSDSCIRNKSIINASTSPYTDFTTNMQISELNSSADTNSGFSKSVEITKTDKRVAFENGQKIQDDFNVSKEKYGTRDKEKSVSFAPLKNDFTYSTDYGDHSFGSTKYSESNSKEIEMLQKPLVYPEVESFQQSYSSYNINDEIILEPGPPPEIGYIPKEAVPKTREPMAERVKKLESSQRQLSPVEIPPGAVKIFPTIIPKRREVSESSYEKKYSSCIKEYKNSLRKSVSLEKEETIQETPNIRVSDIEKNRKEVIDNTGPIYRLQAEVDVRPQSPRPSAEGVSMEKLWSQKKTEEQQSYLRPVTPRGFSTEDDSSAFRRTDFKRSQSPLPSAEGVAMDKLWAHPRSRPHSVIGMDGLNNSNTNTEISFKSEKVESTTWASGSGPPKTVGRTAYEDVYKINDQVVSRNKSDQSYSNYEQDELQRSISTDRTKKTNKKFKWPPEETNIQDSLVRRTSLNSPNTIPVEKKSYPYAGVASKSVTEKQDSFVSNQTLPRSFKFASSNESKFQPVKSFSPVGRRNSDYESDYEVTKISKEAHWRPPGSQVQNTVSSSTFSKEVVTNLASSEKKFGQNFTRPTRESGYTADTEESYRGTAGCFVPRHSSVNFPQHPEPNRTQTLPRVSDHKIPNVFTDDTKLASTKKPYSFVPSVPSPSKFTKSEFRESETTYESDYDARIPPIWRPSVSEPEQKCYRPVRPNFTTAQRPLYNRSASNEGFVSNEYTSAYSNTCKSNFQPVSPVPEYSSGGGVQMKPNPAFSTSTLPKRSGTPNDRQFNRCYSNDADTQMYRNEVFQSQTWQKPGGYESSNYEQHYSTTGDTNHHSSSFTEKKQKVEEIRKRFESNSGSSFSNEPSVTNCGGGSVEYGRSRLAEDFATSRPQMSDNYKFKTQQILDNIVNNVSSKQKELKQRAMKSPSLYSQRDFVNDHQVVEEYYKNVEHRSSTDQGRILEMTRSTPADYVIVNGNLNHENEGPQTLPIFSTPLHDIAAVIGSQARFECIVQSDSPFEIEWRKDDEIVRDSELHQISLRNGVCKLTLLKTYMYDAGTYQCIAMNRAGVAETSATLTVSGERRSYINKK